jgi:hypothetical protein
MLTYGGVDGPRYNVDLNAVHDGNRVGTIVGLFGAQLVPAMNERVVAQDNEGFAFDAFVESVLGDGRVYLRLALASRRPMNRDYEFTYRPSVGLAPPQRAIN